MLNPKKHYVVVSFPIQGHLNPALHFAKHLASLGAEVTFVTSSYGYRRILKNAMNLPNSPTSATATSTLADGSSITFAPFDDGCKEDLSTDTKEKVSELKRIGSQALANVIQTFKQELRPVTCLIHTPLLSWAAKVARDLGVSSAMLWTQAATVFAICHYFYNGYKEQILEVHNNSGDASCLVELPGLPKLTCRDLPAFFLPSDAQSLTVAAMFEEQFESLKQEISKPPPPPPRVLFNTFQELEAKALQVLDGMVDAIPIGPLSNHSIFLHGKDNNKFQSSSSNYYLDWLKAKGDASVVYVSFGSIIVPERRQVEEIVRGLVATGRPFLWALPRTQPNGGEAVVVLLECVTSLVDEINKGEQGLVVEWCSQTQVLEHDSVGCFVSHCGWNSTVESLVAGVPMVAMPKWVEQWTNAKLVEDVWKTGVKVERIQKVGQEEEEEELVESEEIKRCVEMVMGEGMRGQEIRRNAEKWRSLARKAVEDIGGSSHRNLVEFFGRS
ncbi:hypothetical protein Scep_024936 [Stephania cephalantha]|uniref:Glycosyltransferase n=1 Tax=Stephania cephalantha TaxID=152367 RepID=A0AAP0HYQ0_9MAGN